MADKEFHIRSQEEQLECFFPRAAQRANLSYFAFAAEKAKEGDAA